MTWLLWVLVPRPGRDSRSRTQTLRPRRATAPRRREADHAGADDGRIDAGRVHAVFGKEWYDTEFASVCAGPV